jgi:hypothetical protein
MGPRTFIIDSLAALVNAAMNHQIPERPKFLDQLSDYARVKKNLVLQSSLYCQQFSQPAAG